MDFTFTEEQETIGKVARQLFEHRATPEHLTELEAGDVRYDAALWSELATADLLGIALPENVGGSGRRLRRAWRCCSPKSAGASRRCRPTRPCCSAPTPSPGTATTEQQQRYLPGVIDGARILTAGLAEPGRSDPTDPATTARRDGDGWRLDGTKELVPAAQLADTMLIPAAPTTATSACSCVDATPTVSRSGRRDDQRRTARRRIPGRRSRFRRRPASRRRREIVESLYTRALVGLCAIQLGVAERALRMAASYTTEREQFGRPIGSFQAVQQRMADAFIDVEAIRWTTWHAAWLLAQGRPPGREAGIAKFWAAEAGARVAATAQQVHGGIGIDTTYPLFRYFLWAKHNELTLGSASAQLARLGATTRKETDDDHANSAPRPWTGTTSTSATR